MPKEIINQCEQKMQKSIEALKKDFATIRTGKANPAILNGVTVEYYGSPMPINQIASVSAPEPQMILIKPYDKSILKAIEKAIQTSELGFNPQNDGDVVRIPIPALTEQTRKDLVKQAKKIAEENKVAIRNIRRDGMDQLKKLEKDSLISEDELKRRSDELQKVTDKYIENIDKAAAEKEKDIMSI
jgi:ribosome recycling factor